MSTANISNLSIQTSMRLTIRQAQNELIVAQQEVSTGVFSDIGAELGGATSTVVDLTRDGLRLQSIKDTNAIATQRLEASQEALGQMATAADQMNTALIALSGTSNASNLKTAIQTISNSLDTFTSMANTSLGGEYLFAGINTDVQPLTEYTDTSAAKSAFDAEFLSYFGFNQSDSQTANIAASGTAPSMEDFLTNVVEPMYTGTNWTTDWSNATDEVMTSRISQSETVDTSASANSDGMRHFALAAVVAKELLALDLSDASRVVVTKKAIEYTGVATTGINDTRTTLGLSQNRIEKASDSLQVQIDIIDTTLASKTEVDAYDASTRVNNLLSLVEASYTLTAKIQALSLVNYL
ncbi:MULTISPECIES: flagellar hook-associated family protein [Alphaproteobacteria]|uniref:Flagellin n=2 Tax=Alphaproteobacteria TaxID=28211 RepID=A0A512HIG3_9HYPH|nr:MULTISPECIES: flagellar hook-associated family protein [Alphaproteobacteria]GEO85239.1 flagellin [Ciceribacter naphthalenivorans]GLR24427.1 flagellin [Ciceribacter naphthalenivorans]GLT07283.1 flagellin [Sphingomonas psychrolutea]